nr:ribonuclease H-like domain-containing protein [Tanacetum cinerariifolium]
MNYKPEVPCLALPDKHQLKFNSHKDAKTLMKVLPFEWKTYTLIWRNKANLKEHSLDDLFNSLKIYEAEVKHSSSTSNPTQNLAFMSSSNTDSTTRKRKRVVIRDLEEKSTTIIPAETKCKDKGKGIMVEEPKPMKKKDQRYQVMKKRPQTEAQARRNMIMYLKNTIGFRLHYFKGMSYDDIRPIFEAKFNTNIEFLLKSKEQIEEEENGAIKMRLQEEEESEMSLELLRFTRQQYQDAVRSLKKNTKCFNAAGEELSAVNHKLMLLDTVAERRLMLMSQDKTVNENCCR